jgi:hypothetical protein
MALANAHGLQVIDIVPGKRINVDPQGEGGRGDVRLQQYGFNNWTITRNPVQQPNGTYQVPVYKVVQGRRIDIDNIPFADVQDVMGGKRRRKTIRRRKTKRSVTRTK